MVFDISLGSRMSGHCPVYRRTCTWVQGASWVRGLSWSHDLVQVPRLQGYILSVCKMRQIVITRPCLSHLCCDSNIGLFVCLFVCLFVSKQYSLIIGGMCCSFWSSGELLALCEPGLRPSRVLSLIELIASWVQRSTLRGLCPPAICVLRGAPSSCVHSFLLS